MSSPVVGLDFSTHMLDVAAVDGSHVAGRQRVRVVGDWRLYLATVLQRLVSERPAQLWMEHPWVGVNENTALRLMRIVGNVEAVAVGCGYSVHLVDPNRWRSAMLGTSRFTRDEAKAKAIQFVKLEYGLTVGDDMAEAILIARYGWQVARREGLVEAAG